MILLPCLAVFRDDPALAVNANENWAVQPFQYGWCPFSVLRFRNFTASKGEQDVFLEHLRRAVELLRSDKNAVLVISGGQTKISCPGVSEARSYVRAALRAGMFEFTQPYIHAS